MTFCLSRPDLKVSVCRSPFTSLGPDPVSTGRKPNAGRRGRGTTFPPSQEADTGPGQVLLSVLLLLSRCLRAGSRKPRLNVPEL